MLLTNVPEEGVITLQSMVIFQPWIFDLHKFSGEGLSFIDGFVNLFKNFKIHQFASA